MEDPVVGYLDQCLSPRVRVRFDDAFYGVAFTAEDALIDTGCDAVAIIPSRFVEHIAPEPMYTWNMSTRGNANTSCPVLPLRIEFGGDAKLGLCFIDPLGAEVLLGMQFLVLFNRALLIQVAPFAAVLLKRPT